MFSQDQPTYTPIIAKIDKSSLDDPMLVPTPEAYNVITRPGITVPVNFLLIPSSEIEGYTYTGDMETPYLIVQLYDSNNKLVQEVSSEFDGYYFISNVPPGDYKVKISEQDLKNRNLSQEEDALVKIKGEPDLYSDINIYLKKR